MTSAASQVGWLTQPGCKRWPCPAPFSIPLLIVAIGSNLSFPDFWRHTGLDLTTLQSGIILSYALVSHHHDPSSVGGIRTRASLGCTSVSGTTCGVSSIIEGCWVSFTAPHGTSCGSPIVAGLDANNP